MKQESKKSTSQRQRYYRKNLKEPKLGLCVNMSNKIKMIKIGNDISRFSAYSYKPRTKHELQAIISDRIEKEGNECNLNDIDTSLITDMSGLFMHSFFNGDISEWNTSNVKYMRFMFYGSNFRQDISKWDVRKIEDMAYMFERSKFNGDISKWDTSNVTNMCYMFYYSNFDEDISGWQIKRGCNMTGMFDGCFISKEHKPGMFH